MNVFSLTFAFNHIIQVLTHQLIVGLLYIKDITQVIIDVIAYSHRTCIKGVECYKLQATTSRNTQILGIEVQVHLFYSVCIFSTLMMMGKPM